MGAGGGGAREVGVAAREERTDPMVVCSLAVSFRHGSYIGGTIKYNFYFVIKLF